MLYAFNILYINYALQRTGVRRIMPLNFTKYIQINNTLF